MHFDYILDESIQYFGWEKIDLSPYFLTCTNSFNYKSTDIESTFDGKQFKPEYHLCTEYMGGMYKLID